MKITDVYEKYTLTPLLKLHQLRAATVGKFITDNWTGDIPIDKVAVIETLLLHDMGNIIKFDLDNSSKLLGDEAANLNYWKNVQKEFIEKYGPNEHEATSKIARELGVVDTVYELLAGLGGSGLSDATTGSNFNLKICFYSDLRSGPFGILSVNRRFDDLLERYKGRNHPVANVQRTENNRKNTLMIEKQLQEFISFDLASINDAMVSENIELFKDYQLRN